MAEEKNTKVEKETKKLDDIKNTPENKEAIAKADGKTETKKDSKPAVEKASKAKSEKKTESNVELEREYIVPLKRGVLNVPHYRRAKKAVKVLKQFLAQHMKVRDRDLRKIKVDINLNNELWYRGIKKPASKIKVKAKKIDGIVYAELADVPETVKFHMVRMDKRKIAAENSKVKTPKHKEDKKLDDKDKDGINDKVAEKEDAKSEAIKDAKVAKEAAKTAKHTTEGAHANKKMPVTSNPTKQ
ncbi:50S ribosomal protein L31e [Candidatus Pacearchaeota archaeon]|nr:50S ribosomal protein L31e [Candidatus Pacearchaeota archaeon]